MVDNFQLAGHHYIDKRYGILVQSSVPVICDLTPQPDNIYDSKAVAVSIVGCRVGYVPKPHNGPIFDRLITGESILASVYKPYSLSNDRSEEVLSDNFAPILTIGRSGALFKGMAPDCPIERLSSLFSYQKMWKLTGWKDGVSGKSFQGGTIYYWPFLKAFTVWGGVAKSTDFDLSVSSNRVLSRFMFGRLIDSSAFFPNKELLRVILGRIKKGD